MKLRKGAYVVLTDEQLEYWGLSIVQSLSGRKQHAAPNRFFTLCNGEPGSTVEDGRVTCCNCIRVLLYQGVIQEADVKYGGTDR